jgi:hypothetical protein
MFERNSKSRKLDPSEVYQPSLEQIHPSVGSMPVVKKTVDDDEDLIRA